MFYENKNFYVIVSLVILKFLQNGQFRITAGLRFSTTNADSFEKFEEEWKRNYTPTNVMQRAILSFGAAAISLANPRRPELIATLGETTGKLTIIFQIAYSNENNITTSIKKMLIVFS